MVRPMIGVLLALAGCGRVGFTPGDPSADGGDAAAGSDGGDSGSSGPGDIIGDTVVRVASYGGAGNEEAYDIAVAADGTLYATGTTDGGSFMIGGDTLTSAGGEDILLAAFAASGTPKWARRMGSTGSDRAQAVVVSSDGAIFICGLFTGTVDFGGGNVTAIGMWDAFIASYSATGSYRWHRTAGGAGADFCYDLAITPSGIVVATGYYEGAVNFGTGALPAVGAREAFVAQYDKTSGAPVGARGFASAGNDTGLGVAVTDGGTLVVTGNLGGAIDFGDGAKGAAGGSFVVELDANRNHVWSVALAAQTTWDVAIDGARNRILVASRTSATTDLGSGPLPAAGGADSLVLSYDASRQLEWYRTFGGDLSDIALGISVDANGNAYSIGLGGTDIDFGLGLVTGHAGNQDIWVAAHDPAGQVRWGRMFGGTPQDRGYATAVSPDGGLYISGRWAGSTDFGKGPLSASANDMFVLRLE